MTDRIIEIVKWCRANGKDPVETVRDYFAEKDSRITRSEVRVIIERMEQENG
jgi:hypothetical protein